MTFENKTKCGRQLKMRTNLINKDGVATRPVYVIGHILHLITTLLCSYLHFNVSWCGAHLGSCDELKYPFQRGPTKSYRQREHTTKEKTHHCHRTAKSAFIGLIST